MSDKSLAFNVVELPSKITAEEDGNIAVFVRGPKGETGDAATLSIGTVTTLPAGNQATIENVGTNKAAVLDFGIPAGAAGPAGSIGKTGAAATIRVGAVTTLEAGASATVTNVGTNEAAVFDFGIPKGASGDPGDLTNYYTKTEIDTNMAPLASPEFTGTAKGNFIENTQQLGTLTGTTTINCANGSIVIATLGAAIAINLSAGASTSTCRVCTLILTNGGSYVITWSNAIKWSEGLAPTLTANGVDILSFMTKDNGITWYGTMNGVAFA